MTVGNYPQQIYQKDEGIVFYNWCRFYFQLPIWMLLALSAVWPLLPEAWFASDLILGIDAWFRAHFGKLAVEGAAYDALSRHWGTRYVSFIAVCWALVALTNFLLAGPTIRMTWKYGHQLSLDQSSSIWKIPVMLAILGYFMFGQWMDLNDTSPGHYAIFLTRSWVIYPMAAGLAGLFHFCCADLVIYATKVFKFRTM
jgi:hypothetical protein